LLSRLEHRPAVGEGERLRLRVTVVKVHDEWWKGFPAISAGFGAQTAQELEGGLLTHPDTFNLLGPMRAAIEDVVRALISDARHIVQLEHMFGSCQ
jgi:hypothetical protein